MQDPSAALSPGVSAVIPVYNSEGSLRELTARLDPVLRELAGEDGFEIVFVNDGSEDGSWSVLQALAAENHRVRAIDMLRNYGQHNALLCGIRHARHEWVITLDDDLQHPPEELPKLLEKRDQGFDVVYGTPQSETHGTARDLASVLTKLALSSVMGNEVARHVGALRVFRTDIRRAFADYQSPFVSIDVLLSWGTANFGWIPLRHEERRIGSSNYDLRRLLSHALTMLTGFSVAPLRLATWIGFGFTLFGTLVLAFVIGRYLIEGGVVPGFAFLASIIAIFSGAQLFSLGIIGEYIARIHFRTMERPPYTVREEVSAGS